MTEMRELKGESRVEVNGYRSSWARFIDANEFSVREIRRMHDELVESGATVAMHGTGRTKVRLVTT